MGEKVKVGAKVSNYTRWFIKSISYYLMPISVLTGRSSFPKQLLRNLGELSSFLANVNSSSCSLYDIVIGRPSVCLSSVCRLSVCNVRAPYSGDWHFWQYFYAIRYIGHLWPLYRNFTEIVPGEPLRRGLNRRGVAKYSDFGPFQGYISETMQDRR